MTRTPPATACRPTRHLRSLGAAYAVQLDGRQHIALDDFVACAGATTTSLVSGGQLTALDADTELVTLTIGGNDIGWSDVVGACLGGNDVQCAGALRTASMRHHRLPALLHTVYDQVAAAAPNAAVLVTGYPRLFSAGVRRLPRCLAGRAAGPQRRRRRAQRAIADAAAAASGFTFVDVTKRFDGHGVNAPEPWITGAVDPAPFHPNVDGYKAYTGAVNSAARPSLLR